MPGAIIHIGMHKTGSTAIQRALNERLVGSDTYFYPDLHPGGNHSMPLCSMFSEKPESLPVHLAVGRTGEKVDAFNNHCRAVLDAEVRTNTARDWLLSGEALTILQPDSLMALREYLLEHLDWVRVVAYVRAPSAYMSSAFQQVLKEPMRAPSFNVGESYPDYRATFEKFDDVFSAENVELWKFDPATFHDDSVVSDFVHRLNIELGEADETDQRSANESLSLEAAQILYSYRALTGGYEPGEISRRVEGVLVQSLSAMPGQRFVLDDSVVKPVLQANEEDVAWMEQRLGESLSEQFDGNVSTTVSNEKDLLRLDIDAVDAFFERWSADVGEDFPHSAVSCLVPEPEFVARQIDECKKVVVELLTHKVNKRRAHRKRKKLDVRQD